jgi:hypothetical protein
MLRIRSRSRALPLSAGRPALILSLELVPRTLSEVVPGLVEFEVAVPHLSPAVR